MINILTNIKQILLHPCLQQEYWGNSGIEYIVAFAIFAALVLLFKVFQNNILRRLNKIAERTKSDIDDEIIKIVKTIKPHFYSFLAFYLAINYLAINHFIANLINVVLIVWFTYQVALAIQILINYVARKRFSEEDSQFRTAVNAVSMILKIILWVIALLLVLSNLGVNITSLVAGLGIGGVAMAMALKNILSDLFDSFTIYFDRPFLVGDYIMAGDIKGTVQKIGMKTTRIKSPQGEEIVVANSKLTSAQIQNFKKLEERRISFSLGVAYETPSEKLRKIPIILEKIIAAKNFVRFDRAHFTTFADSALVFDVVYTFETPDYQAYLNTNQEINFEIKDAFEKEGIEMAYPTQTVYVKSNQ